MYMLQRAKMKNAVANIAVAMRLSKSDSAVTSIVTRLVSCSTNSCLAFMVYSLNCRILFIPVDKVVVIVLYYQRGLVYERLFPE